MNRDSLLIKNISISFFMKVIGIIISYVTIPITLHYLGDVYFGIWMTIFSTVAWIYNFDLGIGNGLKNNLTTALIDKNVKLAREYISTSYFLISIISLLLFLLLFSLFYGFNIEITSFFGVGGLEDNYLERVVFCVFIFSLSQFVLGLYKQLFLSIHKSAALNIASTIYQILMLVFIIICNKFYSKSLLMLAIGYGLIELFISLSFTLFFFYKYGSGLRPKISSIKFNLCSSIFSLSGAFFIIQICAVCILTTDNLIITKLLGPEDVTVYNLTYKIFQIFLLFSLLILTPYWSLFTDAYEKKDKKWILMTIKKLNILFIIMAVFVLIVALCHEYILKVWLGYELKVPNLLVILMSVFILIRVYGDIYMYFLNAISNIKLQMALYIFGAIINIPLSIFFVESLELGCSGVILATIISMLPLTLVMPVQAFYYIRRIDEETI